MLFCLTALKATVNGSSCLTNVLKVAHRHGPHTQSARKFMAIFLLRTFRERFVCDTSSPVGRGKGDSDIAKPAGTHLATAARSCRHSCGRRRRTWRGWHIGCYGSRRRSPRSGCPRNLQPRTRHLQQWYLSPPPAHPPPAACRRHHVVRPLRHSRSAPLIQFPWLNLHSLVEKSCTA